MLLAVIILVAHGFPRKHAIDDLLVGRLQGGLAPAPLAVLGVRIVRSGPGKVFGAHRGLAEGPAADDVRLFVLEAVVQVVPQVVQVLLDGTA